MPVATVHPRAFWEEFEAIQSSNMPWNHRGGNGRGAQIAAESAALDARGAPLGSDLRAVVSAWPNLPDAIRAGILAMISATK